MKITFKPSGVCCREMSFEVDDNNIITDIDFIGGCPGNLLGLKSLVIGQNAHDVANKLKKVVDTTLLILVTQHYHII